MTNKVAATTTLAQARPTLFLHAAPVYGCTLGYAGADGADVAEYIGAVPLAEPYGGIAALAVPTAPAALDV